MMRKTTGSLCVLFIAMWVCIESWHIAYANPKALIPRAKKVNVTGDFALPGGALTVDSALQEQFGAAISAAEKTFGQKPGGLPVSVRVHTGQKEDTWTPEVREALSRPEAYWLDLKPEAIQVVGADARGALHGLTTLEQLLAAGQGRLPRGQIVDWPDHKIRALHLALVVVRPAMARQLILKAKELKFNTVILQLAPNVRFSTRLPAAEKNPWSTEDLVGVMRFAQNNGLEVIPEVKLLTHQEKLLGDAFPHLMFNKLTYDPRKAETYAFVLPIIDEVIKLFQPRRFHIGHDEVAGLIAFQPKSTKRLPNPGEQLLPPALFLEDVQRLHAYLQERKLETWMWGDMLAAHKEFPGAKHLHGLQGYADLRQQLPRDIVICDWHYVEKRPEFPTARAFAQAGYRVLGATWENEQTIRNFSRYLAQVGPKGEGMIATLWHRLQNDVVDKIITVSGEAFWNAR